MQRLRNFLQRRRTNRDGQNNNRNSQGLSAATATAQQPIGQQTPKAQPAAHAPVSAAVKQTQAGPTLTVALQNQSNSGTVFAYITGLAIDNGNQRYLLQSDAVTPFFPTSPGGTMTTINLNCSIRLAGPGGTIQAQIPHTAGGRIYFSIDQPLQFFLNPGPALVEPSVTNPSDPNYQVNWGFAEFTWNADQLYANITYVDFVSMPIALTLATRSGATSHVSGMRPSGLQDICNNLRQQHSQDGRGWDQLIVNRAGTDQPLRALSPNQGLVANSGLFDGYYEGYVNDVYQRYSSQSLTVDTQAGFGNVSASVNNGQLNFGGAQFSQPSTRDIFSCSTGPFQTGGNAEMNALIPRLAAAFNRSTLLVTNSFPAPSSLYYTVSPTNHYSRIVHQANLDGRGYAFPYDDVQPSGGGDQSGAVMAGDPTVFTVTVGGNNAYV